MARKARTTSELTVNTEESINPLNIGKKWAIRLALLLIIAFVGYIIMTSPTVNDYANEKMNEFALQASSGQVVEQIDREDIKIRELTGWTEGKETNVKFVSEEIPSTLKVSGFENLFITNIRKDGPPGKEFTIKFDIKNLGDESVVFYGIDAIVRVDFTNNPGDFKEYTIEIKPQSEQSNLRRWGTASGSMNIKKNPELYGKFVNSYEIIAINFK